MFAAIMAALPALAQMASSMMNKPGQPYGDAAGAYQKYFGQAQNALNPWIEAGKGAIGNYQNALAPMGNSPAFINNIMSQWQQSPWAQFQQQQGMKAMTNANSASGMAGSGAQMKAAADYSQGLASRDMQQWLQNNLGVNQQYLQGESDISHMGLSGAESLSQLLGQMAEAMGGAAYGQGQAQQNASNDMLGGIAGALPGIMKGFGFGGGGK